MSPPSADRQVAGTEAVSEVGVRRRVAFDAAVAVAALVLGFVLASGFRLSADDPVSTTAWAVDVVVGIACCAGLLLRRRRPLLLALAMVPADVVSSVGNVAYLVAIFTVATTRPARDVALVAALHLAAVVAGIVVDGTTLDALPVSVAGVAVALSAVAAWGMYVGTRRRLLDVLRERADRAEAAQRQEAERARVAERTRIAREMHDVLAHRVSLISLHAGGLQVATQGAGGDVARAAEIVQSTAREAMDDLREVIGVLRTDGDASRVPSAPQPRLHDIDALVDASRAAGLPITLELRVADPDEMPATLGRDAYRIVQEALTNVHKHAGRCPTSVVLDGAPGRGLCVEVRNRLPTDRGTPSDTTGAGAGLLGLTERATIAGGALSHGWRGPDFVVEATLPWRP